MLPYTFWCNVAWVKFPFRKIAWESFEAAPPSYVGFLCVKTWFLHLLGNEFNAYFTFNLADVLANFFPNLHAVKNKAIFINEMDMTKFIPF